MLKTLILSAAACVALAAPSALAQQASNSWTVPDGARVTLDRRTGAARVQMPREIAMRAASNVRFAEWRKTPSAGTGPFPATRVEEATLPTHTLYYPAGLPKKAGKLPVILWANGGCFNTSVEFTNFLGELASRGYFIVAVGRNDVPYAGGAQGDTTQSVDGKPPLTVRGGAPVIAGLDWLAKESANRKSKYYNKVDITKVAALGQSCGGGQVWEASKDKRIRAVAAMNSSFPTAKVGFSPGAVPPADGWTVEKLAIPAAYFIGGPADIAYVNSLASYAATPASAVVIKANFPMVGHSGAYMEPVAEWVTAVSSWLDWQLKGDAAGKAMFVGAECGLCKNPNWWFEGKNLN